ncbi:MAG TPA: hypothetical protein PK264_21465, partial [Hyphomicrobiaceae bacterium]|nr:hypothetical protein [Hyphomicrobiaceae bacterium]
MVGASARLLGPGDRVRPDRDRRRWRWRLNLLPPLNEQRERPRCRVAPGYRFAIPDDCAWVNYIR